MILQMVRICGLQLKMDHICRKSALKQKTGRVHRKRIASEDNKT